MKTKRKRDLNDYVPVDGFVDLRNFKLTKREFNVIWDAQLLFRLMQDKREYYKRHHPWQKALEKSAEIQMFLLRRVKPGHSYE
jgi:hypothetical protein